MKTPAPGSLFAWIYSLTREMGVEPVWDLLVALAGFTTLIVGNCPDRMPLPRYAGSRSERATPADTPVVISRTATSPSLGG